MSHLTTIARIGHLHGSSITLLAGLAVLAFVVIVCIVFVIQD